MQYVRIATDFNQGGCAMKRLIKGGLCVAFMWLASNAPGQEAQTPKWRAATNSTPAVNAPGIRPVSLNSPVALDPTKETGAIPAFRPIQETSGSVVRAQ